MRLGVFCKSAVYYHPSFLEVQDKNVSHKKMCLIGVIIHFWWVPCFFPPFSLLKEPLMTKRFNIFDKRRHTIKVSVFVYHMVENYQ